MANKEKLEDWDALFKFNKGLFETDWNDGQHLVVKGTNKCEGVEFTSKLKVAHPDGGAHKLAVEEKVKFNFSECGGWDGDFTYKNSGATSGEVKWKYMEKVGEGALKNVILYAKGELSNADGLAKPQLGFKYDGEMIEVDCKTALSKDPEVALDWVLKMSENCRFGARERFSLKAPLGAARFLLGYNAAFKDTGIRFATSFISDINNFKLSNQVQHGYQYYESGNNAAGAHFVYDWVKKSWAAQLGLQLKQDDHTWKVRIHNTGLMKVALQWQLHKVCKATLNTELNLKDVPAGKVAALPLGLQLDVKY